MKMYRFYWNSHKELDINKKKTSFKTNGLTKSHKNLKI